jgi:hypothetical protein
MFGCLIMMECIKIIPLALTLKDFKERRGALKLDS